MAAGETWKSFLLADHPASLPKCSIPESTDHAGVAKGALQRLSQLNLADLAENAIWRDSMAMTGAFRTFFGPGKVLRHWRELVKKSTPTDFCLVDGTALVFRLGPETNWVQAMFSFYTHGPQAGRCSGTIGLSPSNVSSESSWKIWLLTTVLEQPEGFLDVDRLEPGPSLLPAGLDLKSGMIGHLNGTTESRPPSVDCLVVGAGVAGLCMAGRLKALGLTYVVVDSHDEVGDVWSKARYDSVKLHTSKQYNQLPGKPSVWGPDDPYLLSAENVSQGFKTYVERFDINVMTSTRFENANFDEKAGTWTAQLRREGQGLKIKAPHIVLAIGDMGVKPNMPEYADRQLYSGDVIHAGAWKNAAPWRGKKGIVVGSANSAHDIIRDMDLENFESITLIQRTRTFVLPGSTFSALVDPVYNDDTPTDLSDRMLLSLPLPIQRLEAMAGIRAMADLDPTKLDKMEANGFKTRRYGDLWGQLYDSQGKHFFDIGAGELIANGRVKVRSDALPVAYTETGLLLNDGSRIDADVAVFATGYTSNFKATTQQMFGDEVAGKLRPFWGTDAEGEVLGAWRHTGHHGIWYTGHGFAHARYYSRFVAMHIKAYVLGKPFEVYESGITS